MNTLRPKRNLATILIEPFKQIKLGVYVIGVSLVFVVLIGAMFIYAFSDQYKHVMEIFQVVGMDEQFELVINQTFRSNAIKVMGLLLLFVIVQLYVVVKMTHKIYGPLVSIERFVGEIAAGNYDRRVTIRKGDELEKLVGSLNLMAESIDNRHKTK